MAVQDSIFGIDRPKFIDSLENEIELFHSVVIKDEPDFLTIQQESIINRHREWVDLGEHWVFQVQVYLWKYADPKAKYEQLHSYLDEEVILFRRSDGEPFKNPEGNDALFKIDEVTPVYLRQTKYYDIVIITFISVDPITQPDLIAKPMFDDAVIVSSVLPAFESDPFFDDIEII